jgi:asparagine synthase (glutamine-hydrolysing)
VPPAHILTYEDGHVKTERYWDLSFEPICKDDEATAIERTRELIKDAVQVRLMSEVPLGAFLSGGIDSSVVVAYMSQMMSQPVKTFSIGFEEDDYSELPYARQVARHFGTDHHEFVIRPDLISILPQLIWAYDEPFADESMLPTYYVSKLAREHVTVVLTGDGGDEIFAGYRHYERELAISRIPEFMRYMLSYGSLLMPDGMRGKKRLRNLHNDLAIRYVQGGMIFSVGVRSSMYSDEYFAHVRNHSPYERHTNEFKAISSLDVVAQMQYVDARTYLTDDILVKVDKASMFNSLETRAPLLDQYLVAYVSSLPSSLRMRNGTLKYLLKKAAADLLPPEILSRGKQGFATPIKHWFRDDLASYAREVLGSSQARQRGIFNLSFVHNLLKEHARTKLVNHSEAIWALLCLELWFQVYMDSPGLQYEGSPQVQTTRSR